jgi:hypothetical protein
MVDIKQAWIGQNNRAPRSLTVTRNEMLNNAGVFSIFYQTLMVITCWILVRTRPYSIVLHFIIAHINGLQGAFLYLKKI